jgi:WD40 repeat protein
MPRHRLLLLCPLLAFALAAEAGQVPSPAKDLSGDPLPAGAVARLGSLRFRHDAAIIFAAFLPGGRSILSVSSDGVACVWEFPSGKPLRRFETHSAKTPAPVLEEDLFASMPASLRAGLPTRAVALSPDGKTLATSDSAAALQAYALESGFPAKAIKNSGFANKPTDIRLHDVATGKERAGWKVDAATVSDLAFSPDGKHLTVWGNDGFARIWDWAQAKEVGKAATTAKGGTSSGAGGLVYAPDGKALLLFRSSRLLQCVEVPTGKALGPRPGNDTPLTAIWFAPDGRYLLTQAGAPFASSLPTSGRSTLLGQAASSTRRWEAATGKDLGPVTLPAQPGNPTIISPDGRVGVTVATFRAPAEARAAKARPAVVFDTTSGKALGEIGLEVEVAPMHRRPLVFSPDGKSLAVNTGTDKEQIDLYEIPGGKRLRTLDAGPGNQAAKKGILRGAVQKLVFSPDGKMLAFHPGDAAAPIVLLDIATGKQAGSITPDSNSPWAALLAFTPDGRCLALEMADGTGALLELATGKPRRAYGKKRPAKADKKGFGPATLAGMAADAGRALAVSPDGKLLALPGPDGAVPVVDVLTGKELTAFKGHTRPVNAVAFSPDGKRLASASADATALVWDVTTLKSSASLRTARPDDLDAWWQALADQDAARAFAALGDFAAVPQQAVAFLKERLRPVPAIEQPRVEKLIGQLDDAQYKVRQKAMRELLDIVDQIAPALDKALAASPTLEARRRLEDLYNQAASRMLQGERLRAYRAVEVLERIGTPEARQVLQALAAGAPGARVTTSARAALERGEPRP